MKESQVTQIGQTSEGFVEDYSMLEIDVSSEELVTTTTLADVVPADTELFLTDAIKAAVEVAVQSIPQGVTPGEALQAAKCYLQLATLSPYELLQLQTSGQPIEGWPFDKASWQIPPNDSSFERTSNLVIAMGLVLTGIAQASMADS